MGAEVAESNAASSGAARFDTAADVQLDRITFGYGDESLFSEFSLKLAAGKVTSIIGSDGCGKSTLLKLISGSCKPPCGNVHLCGRDVAGLAAKERARLVSLLAQEHAAPPVGVRQLVEFGRYPHHSAFAKLGTEDYDAIERALEATGLTPLTGANVSELSGGQRQRAFIAMALAQGSPQEPQVLFGVERAFNVHVELLHGNLGSAYALFKAE